MSCWLLLLHVPQSHSCSISLLEYDITHRDGKDLASFPLPYPPQLAWYSYLHFQNCHRQGVTLLLMCIVIPKLSQTGCYTSSTFRAANAITGVLSCIPQHSSLTPSHCDTGYTTTFFHNPLTLWHRLFCPGHLASKIVASKIATYLFLCITVK